jgi:tetratricopeptide (TPR) repeat protein
MGRIAVLADELRQPSQQWFANAAAAMLALHEGRYDDAEILMARALELGGTAQQTEAATAHAIHQLILHRERGRPADAYDELASVAAASPARPFFRAALAALCAELGRDAEARRLLEELAPNGFEIVPRDNEWLLAAHYLAETCCALGDVTRAAVLYAELEPRSAAGAMNIAEGSAGTLARAVGELAVLLGREGDAVRLFSEAIELDDAGGGRPWSAHARVRLAAVLAGQGEHDEAARLLGEAAATVEELGMTALATRIARDRPAR